MGIISLEKSLTFASLSEANWHQLADSAEFYNRGLLLSPISACVLENIFLPLSQELQSRKWKDTGLECWNSWPCDLCPRGLSTIEWSHVVFVFFPAQIRSQQRMLVDFFNKNKIKWDLDFSNMRRRWLHISN